MIQSPYSMPELVAVLQAVYPGVRVTSAVMLPAVHTYRPGVRGSGRVSCQMVRFSAPLERLKAAGLVSDAMISHAPFGYDCRRRHQVPLVGDDFSLTDCAFDTECDDAPGAWHLTIYTNVEHDEREDRKDLTEARRVLRNIASGGAHGNAGRRGRHHGKA